MTLAPSINESISDERADDNGSSDDTPSDDGSIPQNNNGK